MSSSVRFQRTIGFTTAVSLVIGSIIGSGIFMRPAEMAGQLGSPLLVMLAWVIAGIVTLLSAMSTAEIGAMMPETGGQYVYMKKIYGDFWGYLFGWANFAVINTAGTAAVSFIIGQYFEYFVKLPRFSSEIEQSVIIHLPFMGDIFPLQNFGVKIFTILILAALSIVAYYSTKLGGALQRYLTYAKVFAIVFLVFGLFFSGKGSFQNFITEDYGIKPAGFALVAAMVAACNGALQAFDGYYVMLSIGGEIKNPGRNIPRSLIAGLVVCMIVYLLITAAMLYILPVGVMAKSSLVASEATQLAFGTIGGGIIAGLICINVLGTSNGNVYSPPRMTFAMAEQGRFFKWTGIVNTKHQTPGNAIILQFIMMFVMVLSGSFTILADMYIFIVWLFNLMLVAGVIILRRRMPDAERPYKMRGYPWVPVIVIIFNAFYLVMTLYNDISNYNSGKTNTINSVIGIALTAAGIPLYFYFRRKYKTPNIV
jgi:APA family basic amino acid/polyamine antiporter